MKSIHAIFTDEEYERVAEKKKKSKLNWHDYIYKLTKIKIEN